MVSEILSNKKSSDLKRIGIKATAPRIFIKIDSPPPNVDPEEAFARNRPVK